jgi:hypothetical protein
MAGKQDSITPFIKYTTVLGGQPWLTGLIPCADYSRVSLVVWHGTLLNSVSIGGLFTESSDGDEFTQCSGGPWTLPAGPGEFPLSAVLTKAWFQFGIILGGGPTAGVTFWAEGFLERREK